MSTIGQPYSSPQPPPPMADPVSIAERMRGAAFPGEPPARPPQGLPGVFPPPQGLVDVPPTPLPQAPVPVFNGRRMELDSPAYAEVCGLILRGEAKLVFIHRDPAQGWAYVEWATPETAESTDKDPAYVPRDP